MEYQLNQDLADLWEKQWRDSNPSPELQHFMNHAVEIAKEEFGYKPKGTTPPLEPLKEVTDEDRHFEEDRSHAQEKVLLQAMQENSVSHEPR